MSGRRRKAAAAALAGLVAVAVVSVIAAAFSRDDEPPEAQRRLPTAGTSTTTTEAAAPAADAAVEGPTSTVMADRLAAVTTEAPPPRVALEVRVGGAVTATASGDVAARCLRGPGFLDVDVTAEPPLAAGQFGITSLVFSAPGYRGPGRYDASAADDEEWALGLVDLETEEPFEFYTPSGGVDGSVTIADGGRTGTFDIRGLVDDEERRVTVAGRFTCGTIEG